jgi:4-amino-4-deoxy-L-arabinose transferase-like glycosyltransferase
MVFVLAGVLVIAAAMRFVQLGYAEFHEDEVEVLSLAVRASKGEGYAVFLHRKGPFQMLVPLAFWLLTGPINEGLARLSFAVANLMGVLAVTCLVSRAAGRGAGLVAGILIALNGYLVAFSRMVQYQSFVFLWVSLSILCLWEAACRGAKTLIFPGILCMGMGLLAHFDAAVYLPVTGYLIWQIGRRWPAIRNRALISTLLVLGICLSFYVPYGLDPQFQHTFRYLSDNRVGTEWLYNNLPLLWSLDRVYSSQYYLPTLLFLALALLVAHSVQGTWAKRVVALPLLLIGGVATALASQWPEIYQLGKINLAVLPGLLLTGGAFWVLRERSPSKGYVHTGLDAYIPVGLEVFALWWAVPALAYVFLVRAPGTHMYVMYPGLAALAGLGAASIWRWASRHIRMLLVLSGAIGLGLILGYQSVIFLLTETAWTDVYFRWRDGWTGWIYGTLPKAGSYFGYPRHVGWKGAGYLMAKGMIPDDFRSIGVEFSVPVWYMFETPRSCYSDAMLYLVAHPADTKMVPVPEGLPFQSDYVHVATIYSEKRPRLSLWQRNATDVRAPAMYMLEELSPRFDEMATLGQFGTLGDEKALQTSYHFGTLATLIGYRMQPRPIAGMVRASPGDLLAVWVYWRSVHPTGSVYRAFVHLGENPVWAQQDDDPACRLPTSLWRAGQVAEGQFRLVIPYEIPDGQYPVTLGLYDPITMERLSIWGEDGQELGDAVLLSTVEIKRSP